MLKAPVGNNAMQWFNRVDRLLSKSIQFSGCRFLD